MQICMCIRAFKKVLNVDMVDNLVVVEHKDKSHTKDAAKCPT